MFNLLPLVEMSMGRRHTIAEDKLPPSDHIHPGPTKRIITPHNLIDPNNPAENERAQSTWGCSRTSRKRYRPRVLQLAL